MSRRSSPRPSSMGRRRIAGWEEQDVHTGWRRLYTTFNRAGQSSAAKRRTRRRERRLGERETRAEVADVLGHIAAVRAGMSPYDLTAAMSAADPDGTDR